MGFFELNSENSVLVSRLTVGFISSAWDDVLEYVEFFELSAFPPSSSLVEVLDRGLLFITMDELLLAWVKYGRFLGGMYPLYVYGEGDW